MSKQERIEQCKDDIAKLQENLKELEKVERPVKFGDVVLNSNGCYRIALYDIKDCLSAYNRDGRWMGYIRPDSDFYRYAGRSIFGSENPLKLDS